MGRMQALLLAQFCLCVVKFNWMIESLDVIKYKKSSREGADNDSANLCLLPVGSPVGGRWTLATKTGSTCTQ